MELSSSGDDSDVLLICHRFLRNMLPFADQMLYYLGVVCLPTTTPDRHFDHVLYRTTSP